VGRLSMVERDALPADQRRFHDAVKAIRRRPISGPFIVTMNSSPDLAARFAHLGHYFHSRGQADESILSMRVRTFASLIGSRALDSPYEWSAWVGWALEAGVPQETVDAVREGRTPPNLTAEEALITDFCMQLISGNHRVSDSTYRAAQEHFGVQGLVELVVTIGYFTMIALPLNAFEIEMSAAQLGNRKPFAPLAVTGKPGSEPEFERRSVPPLTGAGVTAPRVPLLAAHEDVKPESQHFFDRVVRSRGWVSGAFQVLLHTPDVAERVAHVGEFFLYESILPPAVRTLTWLITARELDCDYAWAACTASARAAGIDEKLIAALANGGPLAGLSSEQKLLFEFCHQLLRGNHHVTDQTYQAVIQNFGVPAAVQIAGSLGYIAMLALVVNAFEVAVSPDNGMPAL
jgi:4-carboxymuconolactone decarboxylase